MKKSLWETSGFAEIDDAGGLDFRGLIVRPDGSESHATTRSGAAADAAALGADAVGIGRLECWGLAAAGAEGVHRMLEILENEIQIALALLGATSFLELDASHLAEAQPMADPHVTSAFPHLELPKVRY